MKGQEITINVAGRPYKMTAVTAEMERYMRLSAKEINKSLEDMNLSYSEAHIDDKLSIIAVRQSVAMHMAQDEVKALKAELNSLNRILADYLESSR